MATVIQNAKRVVVQVTQLELNNLIVDKATQLGFIDFEPTRMTVKPGDGGSFEILFERVE